MLSIIRAVAAIWVLSPFSISVRVEDVFEVDEAEELTNQQCEDFLRERVRKVTFTDHMAPILQGHWYVQLPASRRTLESYVGSTTRQELKRIPTKQPSTTWDLQRINIPIDWTNDIAVMPTYSLQNVQTKEYLVVGEGGTLDGLALQGTVGAINIKFTTHGLNIFIDGVASDYTLVPSDSVGSSDNKEQVRQMNYVPDLPFIVGGSKEFTWERAQSFMGVKPGHEGVVYGAQRNMFVEGGKIQENDNHVVIASALKEGVCEMNPEALLTFLDDVIVMKELRSIALKNGMCPHSMGLAEFSTFLEKAIEEECYSGCLSVMQSVLDEEKVDCNTSLDVEQIADKITSEMVCTELPSYSLDDLLEYAFNKKCLKWTPPQFLWIFANREVLKQATGAPVCTIHPMDAAFVVSKDHILQKGMCPEGSHCACPDDFTWTDHKMASEIRDRKYKSSLTIRGSLALSNFISAIKAKILVSITKKPVWNMFWKMTFPQLSLFTAGLSASLTDTFWSYRIFGGIEDIKESSATFRCAKTVGCWPILPERTKVNNIRGACRIPKRSYTGGSPVWFMPPPMLKATKLNFFVRHCVLKKCSETEVKEQKVGFFGAYGRDMLNCQPLAWGDMSAEQQGLYRVALEANGVMDEYELEQDMDIFQTRTLKTIRNRPNLGQFS